MSESSRGHAEGGGRERVAPGVAPGHLVITVHGIRTFGGWQADLKRLLLEAEPGVRVLNYYFGYFSAIAFLVPPLRWLVARRFRNFFVGAIKGMPPGSRIDLVAHSFGTYLAASALPHVPEGYQVDTVIFAGSVLRPSFPWYRLQERHLVGRVVNECGWDDTILVICQFSALMMGMAGRVGFQGLIGENFVNRYYRCGHGGYFEPGRRVMRDNWLPLLTGHGPIPPIDERPPLTAWGGVKLFLMNNMQFLKVAGAVLIALAIILIPLDWLRKAGYQKRVERLNHIARLANAARIPGRDPSHVRDLLRIDVKPQEGESSIDHAVGVEAAPGVDDDAALDEPDPAWWERLPGLRDTARDGYRARHRHAQANSQLAAGKQGRAPDLSKAKLLYEDALRSYKLLAADDPAYGSYALCLFDYGLLLGRMGYYKDAAEQFRAVREDVFPKGPKGDYPTRPRSLMVDSLCNEAKMLQGLEDWDAAAKHLWAAHTAAEKEDEYESYVYNELAWQSMQRLEVAKAVEYFAKAKDSCERLVDDGAFIFKTRLYHIRHGLAMAQRLLGEPEAAYDRYDQIVDELQGLMRKDFDLDPKQRRDLAERLINSMERRADVRFFAREIRGGDGRDQLRMALDDYQRAIEQVENDDLTTKTRLLYKKVIAHVIGSLPGAGGDGAVSSAVPPPAGDPHPAARTPRAAIDVQFAEAEQTYRHLSHELRGDLKIYQQVASSCMKLREARRDGDARRASRAVGELRTIAAEHAKRCEKLTRDVVEMLLVAFEVLLEPGVEPNEKQRDHDAATMLAVLGISTRATQHDELGKYTARFHQLAAAHLLRPEGVASGGGKADIRTADLVRPAPGRLFLQLRVGPTWSITLTGGPDVIPPPPAPEPTEVAKAPRPASQ